MHLFRGKRVNNHMHLLFLAWLIRRHNLLGLMHLRLLLPVGDRCHLCGCHLLATLWWLRANPWVQMGALVDSVKMHHVFRLVSHVIYRYFTMFFHCYILLCPCFRYLLIMEHMRARNGEEKCKNIALWCMAFAIAVWRPPWHQNTSASLLKLMAWASAMSLIATVICLQKQNTW